MTGDESFRILIKMNEYLIRREHIDLYNQSGNRIHGDIRYEPTLREKPVIIICHSFMAFKDWGFFPVIGEWFAKSGFIALTFNYSHDGVEGDNDRITDFDKFERNTFSKEVEDTRVVVDAVSDGIVGAGIIDRSKIVLLGHSRGGAIAILHASIDDRVKSVVSWSPIVSFDRWTPHQKEQWKKRGYLPLAKDSTASPLRLGIDLLYDVELNNEKLDLLKAANRIKIPWLILHGKADVTVPCDEAENLFKASNTATTDLVLLDKIGHLYNASTQYEDDYQTLNIILDRTLNWLQTKIK